MKIGFIGGGMMGEALISGILKSGLCAAADIFVAEKSPERAAYLREAHGIAASSDDNAGIAAADTVFLAIKPQVAEAAMRETAAVIRPDALVVSIVAGLPLSKIEAFFPANPVVRVMPNTPLAVGAGMSAYALGKNAKAPHGETVKDILAASGRAVRVEEKLLDAVTGLSGSGPAYAFLVIDALADGGVAAGLPRAMAIELAAQTMLGAAKLVLESGKHPDVLRDAVTSPAGTTIEGIRVLERCAARSAFIEAVLAATRRSNELGGH